MIKTLMDTDLHLTNMQSKYVGKVREVYHIKDDILIMVATDRLSAFDVVLPKGIPYKGQILNQLATKMLRETEDIVPNWLLSSPDPNVSIGKSCEPFKIEMVIRGYLAGHAARIYKSGSRELCGESLPEGIKENDKLPTPIITPATKAEKGHDEDISREEIINQGIVSEKDYILLEKYTYQLYERGTKIAKKQGLILVDTKYEFGKTNRGEIVLIDEIHTPDSSRFWISDSYKERIAGGQEPENIDKEFLRLWFAKNCDPYNDDTLPAAPDELVAELSARYILLYELITGEKFIFPDLNNINQRITENIKEML